MKNYRKKPVTIQAQQYQGKVDGLDPYLVSHITRYDKEGSCFVRTLEGELECKPGDWLIRGVKGEVYSCRDEIFRMTYEEA
jgi:hypothetical protein